MPNLQTRQQLSLHDLIDLLNFELGAYEECSDCHVTAVELAPLAHSPRCNWRGANIEGAEGADPRRQRIIQQVLAETREHFDVAVPLALPSLPS